MNIAIFASGSGSNAENIVRYSREHSAYKVKAILCNKEDAYVLRRAEYLKIPSITFTSRQLKENRITIEGKETSFLEYLESIDAGLLVLAGFLLKIPDYLTEKYRGRILNIHPALLPSYGGKGMYGDHVHRAVLEAGEKESGITIHLADDRYDHGKILYQATCPVYEEDTVETLAARIHNLEKAYPEVIEHYLTK